MSYGTRNMRQKEPPVGSGITIAVPSSHTHTHADLFPHMLKQHNPTPLESPFTPARVNVVVSPHVDSNIPVHTLAQTQVTHAPLYPNQSQGLRNKPHVAEDDWNQHAILTSVAGLQTRLVELDSEIRTAPVDTGNVMRHIQDHASILAEHAKHSSLAIQRQKEVASVTHDICSHMNEQLGSHATALQRYENNFANLQSKQKSTAGLAHQICSELHDGLQAQASVTAGLEKSINLHQTSVADLNRKHGNTVTLTHEICSQLHNNLEAQTSVTADLQQDVHRQGAQIAHMHRKDEVAQTLLTKMLTMVGNHENVISKLSNTLSPDHHVLLDAMCDALEKTKGKLQTFENTQNEMQRILSDFQQGKLVAGTQGQDAESMKRRLDTYAQMSKEMDVQFSQTLQAQQSKIRELEQKMAMMSSNSHNAKLHELEDKVQELSLHQLNSSQNASVMRTTDRDVKLLRHEMSHVHALKQDVQLLKQQHENEFKHSVSQLRSDVQSLAQEQKRNNVKTEVSDMEAKLQKLQRDVMMQDVRIDKTHMHINEMRKR